MGSRSLRPSLPFAILVLLAGVYLTILGNAWLRVPMSGGEFGYTAGRLAFLAQDVRANGLHWWEPSFLGGQQNISVLSYLSGLLPYIAWAGVFDWITAFKVGTLVCLFLGALAAYRFVTDLVANGWAGMAAGLLYLLSAENGVRAALAEHSMMVATIPLAPLSFWALLRLSKSGAVFDALLLAMSFSAALLCYTKIGATLALSLGIYAAFLLVKMPERRANLVRGGFIAGCAAFILGCLPLLPLFREFRFMTVFDLDPFAGWQNAFSVKSASGWLDRGGTIFLALPDYLRTDQGAYYLGVVGMAAMAFVIAKTWRVIPSSSELGPLRIFLWNALVMNWASYGPRSVLGGHFEWLASAQAVADPLILVHWIMLGVQGLVLFWLMPRSPNRVLYFCAAALVYFLFPIFSLIDKLPGLGNLRAPDSFWIVAGTFAWCVAAALAVTWSLRQISVRSLRTAAACGVVVAAFADNTAYAAHFFRGGMPAGTMESFARAAQTIRESSVPGRIRPFSGRYFYLLLPSLTGRGLSTEAGHHNFMQRQAAILENSVFQSPSLLWSYLNIAGISHVFADKENGAPAGLDFYRRRLKTIFEDEFFAVFENPSSLSPAFLATQATGVPSDAKGIFAALKLTESQILGISDPFLPATKTPTVSTEVRPGKFLPVPGWGSAQRVPDGMNITISKPSNGWVVFEDAWHPDWKARIDGRPAQVLAGVGAMPCVQVQEGDREVRFEFRPPWWYLACCVTSSAGWIAGVLGLAVFRRPKLTAAPFPATEISRESIGRPLAIVPTYNEASTLPRILDAILSARPDLQVLVVDDASPDGTAEIARTHAEFGKRVHLMERAGKLGLGSAYKEGFDWAAKKGFDAVLEIDADSSHDPADIPALLKTLDQGADAAVGSRYLNGVRVLNWPQSRLLLSTTANLYARTLTGLPMTDSTSGFKALRVAALQRLDWKQMQAEGYGFQIELHFWLWQSGAIIREVPITFTERLDGTTKMTRAIAIEAAWRVLQLAMYTLTRPAGRPTRLP